MKIPTEAAFLTELQYLRIRKSLKAQDEFRSTRWSNSSPWILDSKGLVGPMPSEIGYLSALTLLSVSEYPHRSIPILGFVQPVLVARVR